MSITVTTDVVCDECGGWIDGVAGGSRSDANGARRRATRFGWVRRGGRDLCDICKEKS